MKKLFLINLFVLSFFSFKAQSYVTEVDFDNSQYKIHELDLETQTTSFLGNSYEFDSYYELSEIFYDSNNNQLVGLHNSEDL